MEVRQNIHKKQIICDGLLKFDDAYNGLLTHNKTKWLVFERFYCNIYIHTCKQITYKWDNV